MRYRHPVRGAASPTRRALLSASLLGLGGGLLARPASGQPQSAPAVPAHAGAAAFHDRHAPVPLTFDAGKLDGLSRALIESHWTNNYGGSVWALNEVNRRLAGALSEPELPAFVYNDLKREHLMRTGSVVLHELYFANLGGNGETPAQLRSYIAASFGTFDRWETEFRRIAAGLGGGSGWVVLGLNRHLGILENYWQADHLHAPVDTRPLLVLDMYEHSYHMDYGAAAARYVDAFFRNIDWNTVAARVAAAG